MPGLVDAHVHLNEPGRTEWEGFETGTRAAAFGGVTTIVDMPLNAIPPTTTVENLDLKVKAAEGQCWVDVGFYGGVIPGNEEDLVPLVKAGVRGFKCFLIESGVEEFPAVNMKGLVKAVEKLKVGPSAEESIIRLRINCYRTLQRSSCSMPRCFLHSQCPSETTSVMGILLLHLLGL